MKSDTQPKAPPDEWLEPSDAVGAAGQIGAAENEPGGVASLLWEETREGARERLEPDANASQPTPRVSLDVVHQLAESLKPDDRLELVARLWQTLPREQRASLATMQLDEAQGRFEDFVIEPRGPNIWRSLFDPAKTSELYSAPRRFDLATIFVVTAAYSLLFGGLTALDVQPVTKIVLGSLVTIVAAAQALFRQTANPRGVSIVAGAGASTLFFLILWLIYPRSFSDSIFFVTVILCIVVGGLMGYVAGVLVGGVFLVADALRGKFEHRSQTDSEETPFGRAD